MRVIGVMGAIAGVAACVGGTSPDGDTDSSVVDSPPGDTQVEDTEEPIMSDTDAIFEPVPGVRIDRGSASYFAVLRQEVWCMTARLVEGGDDFELWLVGMEDGTLHQLASGLRHADGTAPAPSPDAGRIAMDDGFVFLTDVNTTTAFVIDEGTSWSAAVGGVMMDTFDLGYVVLDQAEQGHVYDNWPAMEARSSRFSTRLRAPAAAAGRFLYELRPTGFHELRPRSGEVVRSWGDMTWTVVPEAMDVLEGPVFVVKGEVPGEWQPALQIVAGAGEAPRDVMTLPPGTHLGPACGVRGEVPP